MEIILNLCVVLTVPCEEFMLDEYTQNNLEIGKLTEVTERYVQSTLALMKDEGLITHFETGIEFLDVEFHD